MPMVKEDNKRYIFIDLWETVLMEMQILNNLDINYDRGKIIYNAIGRYNNVEFWKNRIEQEIKEFKKQENKGNSIKPLQRIKRIINKEDISDEEYLRILNEFDQLILNKYMPKVNWYLINKLKKEKNIILISNTGLTTKQCIIQILKKYEIYDMFKDMFFSEDYKYCKPNVKFFEIPMKKYNIESRNILMIGDSIDKDYNPCQKLGIECIIRDWRKFNIKEKMEYILKQKIEKIEICSRLDWKNVVYYCKTLENEYAIKWFKKVNNDKIRFETEVEMYKNFDKMKIKTPQIIYRGSIEGENIIITEWINGTSIKKRVNELNIEKNTDIINDVLKQYEKIWNYKDEKLYKNLLKNRLENKLEPSMILTRINQEKDIFILKDINKEYSNKVNKIKEYYHFLRNTIKIQYSHIINSDISMHEIIIKNNKNYWIDLESFTIGDINNDLAGIFYSLSNSIYNRANEINTLEKIIKKNKYYREKIFIFYLIERVFCANFLDKSIKLEEMCYFINYIYKIIQNLHYEEY